MFVEVEVVGGGTAAGTISNLTKDEQILPGATGFPTTVVGDGKTFGYDNRRPVHGTAFGNNMFILEDGDGDRINGAVVSTGTATDIDGTGLTLTDDLTEIKKDQEVIVSLNLDQGQVIESGASKASVVFVKETFLIEADPLVPVLVTGATPGLIDSALVVVDFTDLHAKQPLRQTLDTSDDDFGDGQRVRAFAFLQDEAGNLGGAAANDAASSGHAGPHGPAFDDDDGDATTAVDR